jgi:hypothetical protein
MTTYRLDKHINSTLLNEDGRSPVYDDAEVGDVLVMTDVDWGKDHHLAVYPQPSLFTVVAVHSEGPRDRTYTLQDKDGNKVTTDNGGYFYRLQDWLDYVVQHHAQVCNSYERRLKDLTLERNAYRGVLVDQGKQQ